MRLLARLVTTIFLGCLTFALIAAMIYLRVVYEARQDGRTSNVEQEHTDSPAQGSA